MQTTTQHEVHLDAKAVAALYDTDLYAWANANAELLRQGKYQQIDVGHLIEEMQDMGKSQEHAIASHMRNLPMHLLKWHFQPDKQSNSWKFAIRKARQEIDDLVQENPSLSALLAKALGRSYNKARQLAMDETGLLGAIFPVDCPYSIEQILSEDWLPS